MNQKFNSIFRLILISVLIIACLPAGVVADQFVGGVPLQEEETGTVSGGLWADAYTGLSTSATKTFSLPEYTEVRWARLYVVVYSGNMEKNYEGEATVKFDGGTGLRTLGKDLLNVPYSFPGEGGDGAVEVSDHCNRVTSDYMLWYDVTDKIKGQSLSAQVETAKAPGYTGTFDGRIKAIVLLVAYDDGDTDEVFYQVNQGHDVDSYRVEEILGDSYVGETTFNLPEKEDWEESELSTFYLASEDAKYRLNREDPGDGETGLRGAFFGRNLWDAGGLVRTGDENLLTYDNQPGEYYKIFLATLTLRTPGQETGSLTVTSSPEGASLIIDDEEAGLTGTTLSLPVGSHSVRVEMEGYLSSDEEYADIEAGVTSELSFELEALTGSLSVSSSPSGAAIYLDNRDTGIKTDATLEDLSTGEHTLVLKLEGYEDLEETVSVEEGETTGVSFELTEAGTAPSGGSDGGSDKENGYSGRALTEYATGSVHGDLLYTEKSEYSGLLKPGESREYVLSPELPENATPEIARLYIYTTWSHDERLREGTEATPAVSVNDRILSPDAHYSDRKGEGRYDYLVETFAYDAEGLILGDDLRVEVTNRGTGNRVFALYGAGLLVLWSHPDEPERLYWITEGSDVLLADPEFGTTSADATTTAAFSGRVEASDVSDARLVLVSTAASGEEGDGNRATFNDGEWFNPLTGGSSGVSVADLSVRPFLSASNTAGIESSSSGTAGDYMESRHACLVLTLAAGAEAPVATETTSAPEMAAGPGDDSAISDESPVKEAESESVSECGLITSVFRPLIGFIYSLLGWQTSVQADPVETEVLNQTPEETPLLPEEIGPGDLSLLSNPPGALIYLDGIYTGRTTPHTFEATSPGNHTLRIESGGYEPYEADFIIRGDIEVAARLSALGTGNGYLKYTGSLPDLDQNHCGGVYVDSLPSGAEIYVDGRKSGSLTPQVISGLKEGLHTIKVRKDKAEFSVSKRKVWVYRNAISDLKFEEMSSDIRTVTVDSKSMKGVPLSLNGRYLGSKLPAKVDIGRISSFVSTMENGAYISWPVSDFLEAGDTMTLPRETPLLGNVLVESQPAGAEIFADGFRTGYHTPFLIENVSVGHHIFSVSKPGYLPAEKAFILSDDPVRDTDEILNLKPDAYVHGSLTVTSEPEGAKIYLYNRYTGEKTPHTFPYMRIGSYQVRIVGEAGSKVLDDVVVTPYENRTCHADL